ncbi:Conserved_hypothetical protein [Hexamita inflata]|uniref:Uncharacterized protein n=1 Tax=Hexamita inflata TaxID=28002 RepID=A0AA86UZ20_9EUKA|nr:Conserved hypothetical protein [Hexamita inflata]
MERPTPVIAIEDQENDIQNDVQQIHDIYEPQPLEVHENNVQPKPVEEPKKNILKGFQFRGEGNIARLTEEPNYVYLARFSPLCKCVKYSILLYICVAAITAAMLSINIHVCGLDASTHTLRMRKVVYPITATGLTAKQNADGVYKTYENLQDTVKFFDFNIYDSDTQAKYELIPNTTQISIPDFPLALVFNFTYAPKIAISSISFTTKNASSLVTEDNGAAFEIQIDNPKRTRMQISEPWFNFDYWFNVNERYNYLDKNLNTAGPNVNKMCGTNFDYTDGSGKWYLADSRDKFSQFPLWFVDMRTLSQADVNCAGDYGVTFKLQQFFCFSPLLIRQVPSQMVTFTDIELNSEIIVDFDNTVNNDQVVYTIQNSAVNRIWLTKASADGTIKLDLHNSNATFYIPKYNEISFFAQSGNISTPEIPMELYQTEFQINNQVGINTIIKIEPVSGQTIVIQTKTTVAGVTQQTVNIGSSITLTFIFEDPNQKIVDGGSWQVKIA